MADLPQLSGSINRKLKLQWENLIEKHGFTGAHHDWPRTRRVKVQTEATPPPRDILSSWHYQGYSGRSNWRRPAADSLCGDPDEIGSKETVLLAKLRFDDVAAEYFSLWSLNAHANYEQYSAWLEEVRMLVLGEVRKLWEKRGDWFDRYCKPKVHDALVDSAREWTSKARDTELQRLPHEVPAESLPTKDSIVVSNGDRAAIGTEDPKGQPGPPVTLPTETADQCSARRPAIVDPSLRDATITLQEMQPLSVKPPQTLDAALNEAEKLASDARACKQFRAVTLYDWYLRELKKLKAERGQKPKKTSERTTLKQRFPWFDVWKVMNAEETAQIETIGNKEFIPSRWALSLTCVHEALTGLTGRTIINYRNELNALKKTRVAP